MCTALITKMSGNFWGIKTKNCEYCHPEKSAIRPSSIDTVSKRDIAIYTPAPPDQASEESNIKLPTGQESLIGELSGQGSPSDEDSTGGGVSVASKKASTGQKQFIDGTYIGQLIGGKACGDGVKTWPDGAVYNGRWKDDKRCGKGQMTYASGDCYNGGWKNDVRCGDGVYEFIRDEGSQWNGDRYVGRWKDGKKHGRGVYIFASGDNYDGEWKEDMRWGKGTHKFGAGSQWHGDCY